MQSPITSLLWENESALSEVLLLLAYFKLKDLGLSDEEALGLDKRYVVVEHVPLIFQPIQHFELTRNTK